MAIIGGIPHFQTYPNFGMGWNGMWLWVSLNAAVPWMENPLNGIFQLAMLDYWRDLEGNFMFCVYIYIICTIIVYIYIYIHNRQALHTYIYIFTYASLRMLCIYIYTHIKPCLFLGNQNLTDDHEDDESLKKGCPQMTRSTIKDGPNL